ncbi:MAG: EAL domain-containing protein, partial [Gammaproteobacteria bacterium]|nr:EAL domain-containing protein [Gammaproteobacteria bacterium]
LRESEERFALALSGANDGIWDWDIRRNRVYFSARCRAILDLPDEEESSMQAWFRRVHPDDLDALKSAMDGHLQGLDSHFENEHRVRRRDGEPVWVQSRGLAVRGPRGNAYRIAGSLNDISRRKLAEERLIHDALHDALTRLPNRSLFLDRLEHAIRRYKRDSSQAFAVLFFDLDRFKTINDSLGHTVGDELLVGVARRLETFLRSGDTLARLGGDEFAILLSDLGENRHVTMVAERIHELLMNAFVLQGNEVFTAASIGIALSGQHYERPEEMLRDADLAMYRAKASPGSRFEVFDSAMHESVLAQHRLEMDLRRAVDRGEFVNYYQTIVSLGTSQRIQGFEALLRWRHPAWGLMSPERFMDIAEETGLIVPIGWLALEQACAQTRQWQQMFPVDPPLTVSVNTSAKFFVHTDFVARIEAILERTGLPSNCLRLEITEQTLMSHADEVLDSLKALRQLGIQLYIDDFGTGYSSLTCLQRFSYDSLKIDRSFVQGVERMDGSGAIVRAIVALADSLNMRVIAEGVETAEQAERLRKLNCKEAQGFWFSQPMPAAQMTDHLREALSPLRQALRSHAN